MDKKETRFKRLKRVVIGDKVNMKDLTRLNEYFQLYNENDMDCCGLCGWMDYVWMYVQCGYDVGMVYVWCMDSVWCV